MYPFAYHRAGSLEDARDKLRAGGEDALPLAGGMTLIPTLKQRLAMPSDLVDLNRIEGLRRIEDKGEALEVGAMATHNQVAGDETVNTRIPALAHLASRIGDPAVRNRGTLGGSIANNDPAADYPGAVVALGATVVTTEREIAADDFFIDMFETALNVGEIITSVRFPVPKRAAYQKFANPASRYAIVGAFVAETDSGVRVAITGAGPTVFRVSAMEEALARDFRPEAVADIAVPADGLNADIHASAEYRAHLVTVMAKRAVAKAVEGR